MSKESIKLIVLDVDGTLTDGGIAYDSAGAESKVFSAKDGLILKALPKLGIHVIFLTGKSSAIVEKRGKELDARHILQGVSDKKSTLISYADQHGIDLKAAAYIGDDLNDYAAMKLCGFKACPADAAVEILDICDYVSQCHGGHGAVRDICEYIIREEGKYREFLKLFGVIL